jgi:hypothetical protein
MRVGTRLLSEYLVKQYHPQLRYVRIHTSGINKATLYAWNDQLQLPDTERVALKYFVTDYLPAYVCYQIEEYSKVQADGIPRVYDLPEQIVQAAMRRNLDQYGVVSVINGMLDGGVMTFDKYDYNTGTLHFRIRLHGTTVTEIEKELIERYLYEIVPIGSRYKVSYME